MVKAQSKRSCKESHRPRAAAVPDALCQCDILDFMLSCSTSARALLLGQTLSTTSSHGSRKYRVLVRPYFTQDIQEGDHVRVPTTHVELGSSSIGPNLPGPMKEPWPSTGGYKYPLLPEGQVFILLPILILLPARALTYFSIGVSCRYPPTSFKTFSSEPAMTVHV